MRMTAGKGESYEVKVFGLFKLRQKSWSNYGLTLSNIVGHNMLKDSPHVRKFEEVLDSGFNAVDSGFSVSGNLHSGSQSLAVFWIPKPMIPDFTTKSLWIPDSTGKNFPEFGIQNPLHGTKR